MTITLTKSKLAIAVLAVVMLVPATAMALHTTGHANFFDDVPDEKFYADAATWAKTNDITTGSPAGSKTFKPEDPVTRGETVTFLKRYNDNIVEPALAAQPAMYWASVHGDGSVRRAGPGVVTNADETRNISDGRYEIDFEVDDVIKCQAIMSLGDTSAGGVAGRTISAGQRSGDASSLFVVITDVDGIAANSAFEVQLWCGDAVFDDGSVAMIAE